MDNVGSTIEKWTVSIDRWEMTTENRILTREVPSFREPERCFNNSNELCVSYFRFSLLCHLFLVCQHCSVCLAVVDRLVHSIIHFIRYLLFFLFFFYLDPFAMVTSTRRLCQPLWDPCKSSRRSLYVFISTVARYLQYVKQLNSIS